MDAGLVAKISDMSMLTVLIKNWFMGYGHYWSCANLSGTWRGLFYPFKQGDTGTPEPAFDACGYCDRIFDNYTIDTEAEHTARSNDRHAIYGCKQEQSNHVQDFNRTMDRSMLPHVVNG